MCERLTRPQLRQLDGNLYVREEEAQQPLVTWSPVAATPCQMGIASLEDLRKITPQFESQGHYFPGYAGALFRSPDLRNYELAQLPPGIQPVADVPDDVRRAVGWNAGAFLPGAFPVRETPGGTGVGRGFSLASWRP